MHDYDEEIQFVTRYHKRYQFTFGCHNRKRAEEEVRTLRRRGIKAVIVPTLSYQVFREVAPQK